MPNPRHAIRSTTRILCCSYRRAACAMRGTCSSSASHRWCGALATVVTEDPHVCGTKIPWIFLGFNPLLGEFSSHFLGLKLPFSPIFIPVFHQTSKQQRGSWKTRACHGLSPSGLGLLLPGWKLWTTCWRFAVKFCGTHGMRLTLKEGGIDYCPCWYYIMGSMKLLVLQYCPVLIVH